MGERFLMGRSTDILKIEAGAGVTFSRDGDTLILSAAGGGSVVTITGAQGFPGLDGEDGEAGVPGQRGAVGPRGLHGLGVPGPDGEAGEAGVPGRRGVDGADGADGAAGLRGIGVPGLDGEDGEDSAFGPQGNRGATGPTGLTGKAGVSIPGAAGADGEDGWAVPPSRVRPIEVTITTTGNIDDLDFGNADLIRMNNAALSTIRGLRAGRAGQRVTLVSVGAGQVDLAHQNAGSAAANRLQNVATSASSSLAAGYGSATYQYDATTACWRLVAHTQGQWITPAYSAAYFYANGAMTWTVEAGDVTTYSYYLVGSTLFIAFYILTSSVGGTANTQLYMTIPGGFTTGQFTGPVIMARNDNGTVGVGEVFGFTTFLVLQRDTLASNNWSLAANTTFVRGSIAVPVV